MQAMAKPVENGWPKIGSAGSVSADNLRLIQQLDQVTYGDCCMDQLPQPTYA
jgi:hypothetical protein